MVRTDGRLPLQLRNVSVTHDPFGYADSSVLLKMGNTHVLAAVSLQLGVPQFLKGQGIGWLTAEYAMLPISTHPRAQRESSQAFKNARSVEISRLIGRTLRSVVDLDVIGEKTIYIDCDVLQADGGTRVACITAASIALQRACQKWVDSAILSKNIFKESVGAISVGVVDDQVVVDLNQKEDNNADVDFNFILTQSGKVVEIQGTSEKNPIDWDKFEAVRIGARDAVKELLEKCAAFETPILPLPSRIINAHEQKFHPNRKNYNSSSSKNDRKSGLFSLGNR